MNPYVQYFRKIPVPKQFMDKSGGRRIKIIRRKICLTLPKFFVEEHFHVSLISGTEKVGIRGGSIKFFRRKFFVSQSRNFP